MDNEEPKMIDIYLEQLQKGIVRNRHAILKKFTSGKWKGKYLIYTYGLNDLMQKYDVKGFLIDDFDSLIKKNGTSICYYGFALDKGPKVANQNIIDKFKLKQTENNKYDFTLSDIKNSKVFSNGSVFKFENEQKIKSIIMKINPLEYILKYKGVMRNLK